MVFSTPCREGKTWSPISPHSHGARAPCLSRRMQTPCLGAAVFIWSLQTSGAHSQGSQEARAALRLKETVGKRQGRGISSRGQQTFSAKDPVAMNSGFVGHTVMVVAFPLCLCGSKASHWQDVNEWTAVIQYNFIYGHWHLNFKRLFAGHEMVFAVCSFPSTITKCERHPHSQVPWKQVASCISPTGRSSWFLV